MPEVGAVLLDVDGGGDGAAEEEVSPRQRVPAQLASTTTVVTLKNTTLAAGGSLLVPQNQHMRDRSEGIASSHAPSIDHPDALKP
ncbi:MAG: hypothetical protein NZ578_01110 [Candidatus Binatia bacterium]|nr:hypothetical protein [Candidatus Binatia bacterium]